jgi:cysteinyl-tRNA synthetase
MSKSAGNFYTLRDLLEKGWTGREIRYALISVNYRLPLNFTFDGLAGARAALQRIDEWAARLGEVSSSASVSAATETHLTKFFDSLDDDLNISGALGQLFETIRESNRAMDKGYLTADAAHALLAEWQRVNTVLGLERDAEQIPADVAALVEERLAARAAKDWKKSDELRDAIAALGWQVKDTKDGAKLTKL